MIEDILTPVSEVLPIKENGSDKGKSKRYVAPIYSFTEILKFCIKIYTELGINSYHSNELIAKVHNMAYNSIKQKLSAAQELKMLEIKYGTGYKLTPLFLKIYKPINDQEKIQGVAESLQSCYIYAKLIEEFNGHPLPSEESLTSRLIRSFGIKEYAVKKAASVFLNNLREYGFVAADGTLKLLNNQASEEEPAKPSVPPSTVVEQKQLPPPPGFIEIPIPLQGGKRAYLKIPEDYKTEDCERIAKFVEALK